MQDFASNSPTIDYPNYATGIGIRPRTCVAMCVAFWYILSTLLPGANQVCRATQPTDDMAVSITGTDFSSLDAFITILHKLASNDFASKRLPRHCAIRKQIEAFLQSSVELEPLSAALHEEVFRAGIESACTEGKTPFVPSGTVAPVSPTIFARK